MLNKYSILISIYYKERGDYLKDSINSILAQTILPEQIVIVKDGELTEELNDIITSYQEEYPDIFTILQLEENMGLGLALNKGLQVCRNNLVARMDTDDIALAERCEKQLKEFNNDSQLSLLGTNISEFNDDPDNVISQRIVPSTHTQIVEFSKKRNPFNHPTMMYKRKEVLEVGGYGDFRRNQDYELFVRMLNKGYKAKNINESLLLFRANNDNLKRRKSWNKCKSDIEMRYEFWKKGYSSLTDFLVASGGFLFSYIAPVSIFNLFSKKFLRN